MRLLVLGGTVFLSRAVAVHAGRRGHEVTCAARGASGDPPEDAEFVRIDRDAPESLAALDGRPFDAVVDVARRPTLVRQALERLADRVGHWTFVSTISVYADEATPGQRVDAPLVEPASPDMDEADPANYGPCKVASEHAVRAAAGDRAFICRAGLIVGPGDAVDRFGYWPLRFARGGEILAPGSPTDLVQCVDVRDLAAWIVHAAESNVVGTFDGTGLPMPRSVFFDRIAAGTATTPDLTWVDQDFLQAHGVNPWMGPRSLPLWLPLPQYAGHATHDVTPSIAAGLTTRDLADTARDTLDWEREVAGRHDLAAGLTEAEEEALLRAWHAR